MGALAGFDDFFQKASGCTPYPYQHRLATSERLPSLVSIPTGLGKTAAVILGWLWRRRLADPAIRAETPRRLVYCLPMRVLVEQTVECAKTWLANLGLCAESGANPEGISVYQLMGGEVDLDWDIYPEREAIIIGTQDMLLSRALNRGYAMSRFRWPIQFGLLNNDCLWVMDEVQLMGNGLATTAQLQAFRQIWGTYGPTASMWMSATMRPEWLETVDFRTADHSLIHLELDQADLSHPEVFQRLYANKPVQQVSFQATKDGKQEADLVRQSHQPGTLTLVVVNQVDRARKIYESLAKWRGRPTMVLVHSRFRPADRLKALKTLLTAAHGPGTIAISTQVVEAGVDVSAKTLITDLAPWSSLVQRFGRANRYGLDDASNVMWIDSPLESEKSARPYTVSDLEKAREKLTGLNNAAPHNLPKVDSLAPEANILRQRDLKELFDTTPDLTGVDLDISRFIRDSEEHDLQVFWREVGATGPGPDQPGPNRNELCSVPVYELQRWQKIKNFQGWRWDHLEKRWIRPTALFPGLVVMLPAAAGGYSAERGWTGRENDIPEIPADRTFPASANDDDHLVMEYWQTLAQHTDQVVNELDRILNGLFTLDERTLAALAMAARWHDAGKSHPVFQQAATKDADLADTELIWAKSAKAQLIYERKGFRHELASALAMLSRGLPDLAAYLAAAHHGKVRMSIRSLPTETPPADAQRRFARGLWDDEEIGPADLGGGQVLPVTRLDLSLMELGEGPAGPSWLARVIALRDSPALGIFRLAYLEALLRAADWRASANKEDNNA